MDYKHPQQQIFDAAFASSLALGYRTVDYLPAEDFGYPFVFIGENFLQTERNKSILYGRVQQTVHIYHDRKKRRELTGMMLNLEMEIRQLRQTDNFYITVKDFNSQTLIEDNGLLHGVLEFDIQFH